MDLVIIFFTAFLITAAAIPLTIKLARKYGLVDDPNLRPHPAHLHKNKIPRAGGIAIYLGIIISAIIFLPLQKYLVGIILGSTILLALGLIDDKKIYFNPYFRLGFLFLAAALAVSSGIGISFISNPLYQIGIPAFNFPFIRFDEITFQINFLGTHNIILIADIFAFLFIVTITQIINWSKGVDGQMPGITLISAIVLGLLSLKFYYQGDQNQLILAKLSFIVAGTSLGFLLFNWHPAKIFPGFSGSTILAFLLASISILSGAKVATALLVLAIPTIDFFFTFFRRIASGRSPVWGDRGHLHHRLIDLGWSHKKIALFYMLFSAILGAVALLVDSQSKFFSILVVGVIFLAILLWLNSFAEDKKNEENI